MDENRIAGTARKIGGKAQESVGRAFGDSKTQAEGVVNQVKGTAQDLYGQARDNVSQIADAAGDTVTAARSSASSLESNTIETATRRSSSAWDGCLAGCIGRSSAAGRCRLLRALESRCHRLPSDPGTDAAMNALNPDKFGAGENRPEFRRFYRLCGAGGAWHRHGDSVFDRSFLCFFSDWLDFGAAMLP